VPFLTDPFMILMLMSFIDHIVSMGKTNL
jgi:hypothetical protein